jgi:hypothetical protein
VASLESLRSLLLAGFTALGLRRVIHYPDHSSPGSIRPLLGILFPVQMDLLAQYDLREIGYTRVEIDLKLITIHEELGDADCRDIAIQIRRILSGTEDVKVWVYIPEESKCVAPDKNFPILQSYVRTHIPHTRTHTTQAAKHANT